MKHLRYVSVQGHKVTYDQCEALAPALTSLVGMSVANGRVEYAPLMAAAAASVRLETVNFWNCNLPHAIEAFVNNLHGHVLRRFETHGLAYGGVIVSEYGGPPSADVVDQFAVIRRRQAATVRLLGEEWGTAHGAEGPHGRVHSAGDEFLGAFEEFGGVIHAWKEEVGSSNVFLHDGDPAPDPEGERGGF